MVLVTQPALEAFWSAPFRSLLPKKVKLEAGGPAATAAESDGERGDEAAGATGSRATWGLGKLAGKRPLWWSAAR